MSDFIKTKPVVIHSLRKDLRQCVHASSSVPVSPYFSTLHIDSPVTDLIIVARCVDDSMPLLDRVIFGRAYSFRGFEVSPKPGQYLQDWAKLLKGYLDGENVLLRNIPIDLSWTTAFQKDVFLAAQEIKRGEIISYAELARRSTNPGAVRATASALRKNRFPLIIPCHRVVRRDGRIGGFCGAADGRMVALKKALLKLEGCNSFD